MVESSLAMHQSRIQVYNVILKAVKLVIFNISLLISNEYGRAVIHPDLYRVSAQEDLYHIQRYAGKFFIHC